jgi:hypothetical protein
MNMSRKAVRSEFIGAPGTIRLRNRIITGFRFRTILARHAVAMPSIFLKSALPFHTVRRQHNFHSLPLSPARLQIAKRYRIIAFLQSHNFIYKLRGTLNAQAG